MGMYDYLNGEQVKCFYIPIFYYSEMENEMGFNSIHHSGGQLIEYHNGDKLPLKTRWYKYSENLIILDSRTGEAHLCPKCKSVFYGKECDECQTKATDKDKILSIIHVIKDGYLFDTFYDFNKLPQDLFEKNPMVVNYYGDPIYNINNLNKLKSYIYEFKQYQENYFAILEKYGKYSKDYFSEYRNYLKNKTEANKKKLKKIEKIYNEQNELKDKEIKTLKAPLIAKYSNAEKNQKELILMQFGEYIDCFFQFAKKEDEKNDQKEFFLKEFKLFKEAYPDILNNYFLWNETNKNEQKIIIDIFKNL